MTSGLFARRPTSTLSSTNLALFGGSASAHAATADASDLTYIRLNDPGAGWWSVKLQFATATIAANEYITRVRVRMRIAYDLPGPNVPIVADWKTWMLDSSGSLPIASSDHWTSVFFGTQDPHDIYGAWKQPSSPTDRAWTSSDLVTPVVEFNGFSQNNNFYPRIMGVWLEHEVRTIPTTTVTAPTGTQTITNEPTTVFAYNSIDGYFPTGYQVRIFSAAQYGIAGFNAETSPNTWDSDIVRPKNFVLPSGVKPTIPLPNNTTYKSYVQTRNGGSYSPFYVPKSLWVASPTYTLNVNPPAVPTISANTNQARAQNDIIIQGNNNMLSYDGASFELTTAGWVCTNGNATVTRSTTKSADGVASLRISATAAGNVVMVGPVVPVVAGQIYMARTEHAAGSTLRLVQTKIDWLNNVLSTIGTATAVSTVEGGTTFPGFVSKFSAPVQAPIGAVLGRIGYTVFDCAPGELHYMDKPAFKPYSDSSWTRGGLTNEQYITLWRSVDGGANEMVLNNALLPVETQTLTFEDGSIPNGLPVTYTGRTTSYDTTTPGEALSSAVTAPTSPRTLEVSEWWLRDLQVPGDSIQVSVDQESFRFDKHEEMAEYSPIGSKFSVIISDVIKGITAPLKLDFLTYDDYLLFVKLHEKQKTLLLKSPLAVNQQWYIRIRTDTVTQLFNTGPDLYCTASMEVIEQDVPSV